MTHPLLPQSSMPLKQRLLTGASAAVIVLALGVAMPSGAMAQTELDDGDTLVADDAAGFIESDEAAPVVITVDIDAATGGDLNVGNTAGVSIEHSDTDSLTLNVADDNDVDVNESYLVIDETVTTTSTGTIAINLGGTNSAGIVFNGDVIEDTGAITIQAGDIAGGTIAFGLIFATDQDRDLTIDAAISAVGDDDIVLIIADTDATNGNSITFTDTVNIGMDVGDVILLDGTAAANALNGDANYDAAAATVTAVFQGNVTAGSIDLETTDQSAALVLGADGAATIVTANVDTLQAANTASLTIADAANVTLVGDIENTAGATGWDTITVGAGAATTFTVRGDIAAEAPVTLSDNATLVIDSGVAISRTVGTNSTIDAGGAGLTTTLQTIGSGDVTFQAEVGTTQEITTLDVDAIATFEQNVTAGDLDVDASETASFDGTTNILTGDIIGDGTLELGDALGDTLTIGTTGESSTVSIANFDGGGAGFGSIAFASGSMVTIETAIGANTGIGNFALDDADTVVTFNTTAAVAVTGHTTATETLDLGAGTIVLGSNIGDGDTVFSFTGDTGLVTTGGETTTVQLSANVGDGDVITFAATGADQSLAFDGMTVDGELEVTQTALTTFALAAAGNDITITATARSASDTADELGISEEDAVALRQAVVSTDEAGDDDGFNALNTALNADDNGASAALAAQQVGTQEDTLGGASQASFALFGEQAGAITDRLQNARSQSGFSGGDLDGPYSPQAPSSMGGVWGQAFGGVANADGDSNFAGWDAAYGGMMIGIDGMVSDDITIGAFGSYSYSNVDGDGAGNSEIEANTFGFGVYAGYAGEGFYLDGFAAYAMSQNDLSRQDVLNRTITADYDASQFSIGAAGGVPIEVSSNVFITPNASLTWNHYDADSYTETGSPLAQTVNPDAVSNLTGTIGARIHAVYENFDNDGTVFIPELRVALIGDLIDDDATATATFAGAGVASYQVTGADTDDIGALIGLGFGLDNPDWSAGISYDADLRGDFMSHTGRAEFRWKF